MSVATGPQVEIDDRIRQRPDLLAAASDATEYLLEQAEVLVPPPGVVRWQFADREGASVEIALADAGEADAPFARRNFLTRRILDPVSRRMCVLQAWSALLSNRSDLQMRRINEHISQLEEEERNGEQVTERTRS